MNKFIALLTALIQLISLYACGNKAAIEAHIAERHKNDTVIEETVSDAQDNPETEAEAEPEVAVADGTRYVFPERVPVKFSEMKRDNYDEEAALAALADMEEKCEQDGTLEDLKADYDILARQHDCLSADYNVTYVLYCLDSDNDEIYDEYSALELKLTDFADKMLNALQKVLGSQYAEDMTVYINCDGLIDEITAHIPMTDEQFKLVEENTKLVDEYYDILDSGAPDSGEKAADLYLKVLDNLIAQESFDDTYETYAEDVYANSYMRDYTPDDLQDFREWVRDFVVPYYIGVVRALRASSVDLNAIFELSYEADEVIEKVKPYVTSVSPKALEAFEFMEKYELYDIDVSSKKLPGGYTTTISLYGTPYIFNAADGSISDIQTLIHEFGHYYEAYNNMKPGLYDYGCYDTAEIDSQGMESLMMFHTADIFGKGSARIIELYSIYLKLYPIIDGVVFDEFQQRAFEGRMNGTIKTGKQLTELFLDVEDYYYQGVSLGWGEDWYQVPHTFDSPFYYISYATSATAALGFLMMGYDDYDAAVEKYVQLIDAGCELGFCATLDYIGMPNPISKEGCDELSEGLAAFFESVDITPYYH